MISAIHNMNLEQEITRKRRAQRFNLWLGMIGMFMMFAALSSGFIVYTASSPDKGLKTILPDTFIYSTIIIVVSSITMHLAYSAIKKGNVKLQQLLVLITTVLGIVFFILQVNSWGILTERGVYFVNTNASQSFIYIFTGMHLAHIIGGLWVLLRCYVLSLRSSVESNVFRTELATIFWHFLDFVWLFIYVFLLLNQ